MKKRHQQKLQLISIFLLFAWNVPFILIFNFEGHLFGFPTLYAYIFLNWIAVIAISYSILQRFYE